MKKGTILLTLMLAFFVGTSLLYAQPANALPGARVYVYPSLIDLAGATVGTKFNVTVWIENVTTPKMDGWQIEMHFDDSVINVTTDGNNIRAWPSALRAAQKYNTSYVFYNATVVSSSLTEPVYAHVGPKNAYALIADVDFSADPGWNGTGPALLTIIEFEVTNATNLASTLAITNEFNWIKPDEIQAIATFQSGFVVPEFSSLLLVVSFAGLAVVAVVFRKKLV